MAEAQVKLERQNHDKVEDDDNRDMESLGSCSSILAGLNLALILSSLSLSDEERRNFEAQEEEEEREGRKKNCDRKGKGCAAMSNNRPRRQEVNEFRAMARQMGKMNTNTNTTKIRDCRHGRKM